MADLNVIEIKKDEDGLPRVYIDGIEIKGLKTYRLVDRINPTLGREQELTLVIALMEELRVS